MGLYEKLLLLAIVGWCWLLVYRFNFGNIARKLLKVSPSNNSFFVSDKYIKLILYIVTASIVIGIILDSM